MAATDPDPEHGTRQFNKNFLELHFLKGYCCHCKKGMNILCRPGSFSNGKLCTNTHGTTKTSFSRQNDANRNLLSTPVFTTE